MSNKIAECRQKLTAKGIANDQLNDATVLVLCGFDVDDTPTNPLPDATTTKDLGEKLQKLEDEIEKRKDSTAKLKRVSDLLEQLLDALSDDEED